MISGKTVTLPDDLYSVVVEIARAEGKTPDELIEETTRRMLQVRGLRSFVAENRRRAESQGFTEADVPRLLKESRLEHRGR